MINIEFLDSPSLPDAQQIFTLYQGEGWWVKEHPAPGMVERIVQGSHCFAVARTSKGIVGMGRAISDGVSDAYIQDVTVHPDFRGRGIAGRIVRHILARLREDGISWIGLIAQSGTEKLYQRNGFSHMQDTTPMYQDHYGFQTNHRP